MHRSIALFPSMPRAARLRTGALLCAPLLVGACNEGDFDTTVVTTVVSNVVESDTDGPDVTTATLPTSDGGTGGMAGESGTDPPDGTTGSMSDATGTGASDPTSPVPDCGSHPSRLIGLTWNYATEAPEGAREELRCISTDSGSTELIAAMPGMDWLLVGANAYDREQAILYAVAFAEADGIYRIFAIDSTDGALLGAPPIVPPNPQYTYNWSGGLHVRADGQLVGLTWNFGGPEEDLAAVEELRRIDPETGASVLIAEVLPIESLAVGASAYDSDSDAIHVIGYARDAPGQRLFTVDAGSGALVAQPAFEVDRNWSGGLHVRSDHVLVGMTWVPEGGDNGVEALFAVDAETAQSTLIAEIPQIQTVLATANTYDPVADEIRIVGANGVEGGLRLYSVDASSGEVVSSPELDTPGQDHAYNWSGGLHVR